MPAGNRNFPSTIYESDQLTYESSKIDAAYVVETIGIAAVCFSTLLVDLKVVCVTFVT